MRNTLHWIHGGGTFAKVGCPAGRTATDWTWGIALMDVDLDGELDGLFNSRNEGSVLLQNESKQPRLAVRLEGLPPTSWAQAPVSNGKPIPQVAPTGGRRGRYLSSDDGTRSSPRAMRAGR